MVLEFKDIQEWKPTSISIVDQPAHPLAVFEVYEDDAEFIKKYEVNKMTQQTKNDDEKTVNVSESFLEKILGGLVSKAVPEQESKTPAPVVEGEGEVNIIDAIKKLNERFDKIEERISKIEKTEEKPEETDEEKEDDDPVPGAVTKSEELDKKEIVTNDGTINTEALVSKSIDPDNATKNTTPAKSFMERIGRSEDGMKW